MLRKLNAFFSTEKFVPEDELVKNVVKKKIKELIDKYNLNTNLGSILSREDKHKIHLDINCEFLKAFYSRGFGPFKSLTFITDQVGYSNGGDFVTSEMYEYNISAVLIPYLINIGMYYANESKSTIMDDIIEKSYNQFIQLDCFNTLVNHSFIEKYAFDDVFCRLLLVEYHDKTVLYSKYSTIYDEYSIRDRKNSQEFFTNYHKVENTIENILNSRSELDTKDILTELLFNGCELYEFMKIDSNGLSFPVSRLE